MNHWTNSVLYWMEVLYSCKAIFLDGGITTTKLNGAKVIINKIVTSNFRQNHQNFILKNIKQNFLKRCKLPNKTIFIKNEKKELYEKLIP